MNIGDEFLLADGSGKAVVTHVAEDSYFFWARVHEGKRTGHWPFACEDGRSLAHKSHNMCGVILKQYAPGEARESETTMDF